MAIRYNKLWKLLIDKEKMKKLLADGNEKKLLSEKMRRSKIYEE